MRRIWRSCAAPSAKFPEFNDRISERRVPPRKILPLRGLSIPIREVGGSVLLINLSGPSSRINAGTSRQLASVISNLFRLELDRFAPPHPKALVELSPRQRQCLSWVAQGKTSSDICMILEISRHTVEYHIAEAMKVLNVNSRIAAAVIASNYGLLD